VSDGAASHLMDMARLDISRQGRGVQRFGDLLRAFPGARITEQALWGAFAEAFPRRPVGPEERAWLLAALERLADAGTLRLPSSRSRRWDRSALPAVPRSIDLVRTRPRPDESWRRLIWHPALAWAPELKHASSAEVAFLRRVHDALVAGGFAEPAPLKYRSLVLTGDEKRLSKLVRSRLFADGRLSLALLNCHPDLPPLAWTRVGHGRNVLVFENAGPTDLALRLVQGRAEELSIGVIAYGAGAPFASSVVRLSTVAPDADAIWYVGDIDCEGLRTAAGAAASAKAGGLPRVLPAPGFHDAMVREAAALGSPLGWPHGRNGGEATVRGDDHLVAWLPAAVRDRVSVVLDRDRRIPEEVLGPAAMQRVLAQLPTSYALDSNRS
jgi:hypothetical protein